tara:strand:- start:65 stop:307 length:243 start_codon:yes stop_codon:yes gene_type:complete
MRVKQLKAQAAVMKMRHPSRRANQKEQVVQNTDQVLLGLTRPVPVLSKQNRPPPEGTDGISQQRDRKHLPVEVFSSHLLK